MQELYLTSHPGCGWSAAATIELALPYAIKGENKSQIFKGRTLATFKKISDRIYLQKYTSVHNQRMIVQITAGRQHQQVWNHLILLHLFSMWYQKYTPLTSLTMHGRTTCQKKKRKKKKEGPKNQLEPNVSFPSNRFYPLSLWSSHSANMNQISGPKHLLPLNVYYRSWWVPCIASAAHP